MLEQGTVLHERTPVIATLDSHGALVKRRKLTTRTAMLALTAIWACGKPGGEVA